MPNRILHLIDPTTSTDAFELLASLIHSPTTDEPLQQRVVGIGHHQTKILATRAGIRELSSWAPSIGWADPTGWRAIRRIIKEWEPTHVHAWGIHGVIATEVSRFQGIRLATCAELPANSHLRLMKRVDRRANATNLGWKWIATSHANAQELINAGVHPNRVATIRPGFDPETSPSNPTTLRDDLDLSPDHHPVILLGGEGPRARHDHGLWSAAILQQIFPNTRAILREDVRGKIDLGLGRFAAALPKDDMLIIAPSELPWKTLLPLADILLITPDAPISTGSVLHAMAAGVPIIATPTAELSELIQHTHNGLLANGTKPREIAAQLEVFMNDPALGPRLAATAQKEFSTRFPLSALLDSYRQLYQAESPATLTAAT